MSPTQISVAWDDAAGESGYVIEVRRDGGSWQQKATTEANQTQAEFDNLDPGVAYEVRVRATNDGDGEAPSEPSSGFVVGSGTTKLGVNHLGNLNGNSSLRSERYQGWGLADLASGVSGFVEPTSQTGSNLTVESFTTTATTATSELRIGSTLRVTHDYPPSTLDPNIYELAIAIENIGGGTANLVYRWGLDWIPGNDGYYWDPSGNHPNNVRFISEALEESGASWGWGGYPGSMEAMVPVSGGPWTPRAIWQLALVSVPAGGTRSLRFVMGTVPTLPQVAAGTLDSAETDERLGFSLSLQSSNGDEPFAVPETPAAPGSAPSDAQREARRRGGWVSSGVRCSLLIGRQRSPRAFTREQA